MLELNPPEDGSAEHQGATLKNASPYLAVVAVAIACASFASSPVRAQSEKPSESIAPPVELSPEVMEKLKPVLHSAAVAAPLKSFKLDLSGGQAGAKPAYEYFERLPNGLWAVALVIPMEKGANVMRALSLQGMVNLALTIESYSEMGAPIANSAQGMLPFVTRKSAVRASSTRKSTSVSGDLAALVAPHPGSKFSYSTAFAATSHSGNSNHRVAATCLAGESMRALKLHPALKGRAVPLSCKATVDGNADGTLNYAYLVDSRLYVLTGVIGARGKETEYRITDVEFAGRGSPK